MKLYSLYSVHRVIIANMNYVGSGKLSFQFHLKNLIDHFEFELNLTIPSSKLLFWKRVFTFVFLKSENVYNHLFDESHNPRILTFFLKLVHP